jgi:hypothetical protein
MTRRYRVYRSGSPAEAIGACAALLALVVLVFLAVAGATAFLWNAIVPALFGPGAPTLDLWSAAGLLVLLNILAAPFRRR